MATSKRVTKGGATTAEIFAGGFFFEIDAAGVASTNLERQADGDSTLRARLRGGRVAGCSLLESSAGASISLRVTAERSAPAATWCCEESLDAVEHFLLRVCRVHSTTKFAAVPHAMRKPASELLHFANTIGQVGSGNFLEIARK